MVAALMVAALLLSGILLVWIDRNVGRRVGWLVLLAAGGVEAIRFDHTEAGTYRLFLVGLSVAVVFVIYAITHYLWRVNARGNG